WRDQVVTGARLVATGDDRQAAILRSRVVEEDHDGQQVEVGVWEERVVLVPLKRRRLGGRFEVQRGIAELDVRPDQLLDDVENLRIEHDVVKGAMAADRVRDLEYVAVP